MSFRKLVRRANAKQQTMGGRTKAISLNRVYDDLSRAFSGSGLSETKQGTSGSKGDKTMEVNVSHEAVAI